MYYGSSMTDNYQHKNTQNSTPIFVQYVEAQKKMIKNFKKQLLKDYHCDILMRAEKTNILCGDEEGKVLLLRIVCQETHSDMT